MLRSLLRIAAVIVAYFAMFHGRAHGRGLPEGTSMLLCSLGFVVAAGLLILGWLLRPGG